MKIICTNKDDCAFTEEVEVTDNSFATTCSRCGSLALIYTDSKKCIYNKNHTRNEINNLILKIYFTLIKGEDNDKTQ
jgi:hypothetical protein